ncbi:18 kDa heat shock protein [Poriferisphaera corsica]|uniref:18 kDa heat shock protein n=1 Tax=Poriferisphaera corsica TaxID=2528020 RepID=A0A517YTI2_9BACT|nr:Hsp20/alpha crystallin family protein [Poriferisphaera corsica]QDU33535.1 18 kDa heat shock protein [Poriferisphaera corsica]
MKKPKSPQPQHASLRSVVIDSVTHMTPDEGWQPPVNTYETPHMLCICFELPGLDKSQIHVTVQDNLLQIAGTRPAPIPPCHSSPNATRIHAMEINHGTFSRKIRIPNNVDLDKVESEYTLGLLWVKLPLVE